MDTIWIEIIILLVLILANGVFAMCEMAIVSSRKSKLSQLAKQGNPGAVAALQLAENPSKMLSSVQVGITLIGIFTGAFGGARLAQTLSMALEPVIKLNPFRDQISLILVVIIITYFSLVIGELVPKRIALGNSEKIASLLSRPMSIFSKLMTPLVHFLSVSCEVILKSLGQEVSKENVVTEAEIRQLIKESAETGSDIQPVEEQMVQRIFRLGDARLESLMTPRTKIEWIDLADSLDEVVAQVVESKHSRFPVALDELDQTKGFLYTRDLLKARDLGLTLDRVPLREALFVPKSYPALHLFTLFQEKGQKEALVIDEYGGLAGLISLYDLISEVMGLLPSEEDATLILQEDGSWLIDGMLSMDQFKEEFEIEEELFINSSMIEYNTVGGWVTSLMGKIPVEGEHVFWQYWEILVVDMDRARIDKIMVRKNKYSVLDERKNKNE